MDKIVITKSAKETQKLGEDLAKNLNSNFLALYGELGSGKTSFVQGFAKGLGVRERIISPTFVLIRSHETDSQKILYHVDLYRVEDDKGINEQLLELLSDKNCIVVVEWAEKFKDLPKERINIWFRHLAGDEREIVVKET